MKTSCSFINEYSLYDEITDVMESCRKEIAVSLYNFDKKKTNYGVTSFFEDVDDDYVMEQEQEGVLAKIGASIMKFFEKIAEFIRKISDTLFKRGEELKSDAEIVSKIIAEHPEKADIIVKGINEKWFTYKDLVGLEKDTVALFSMLEKEAIDHRTFKEKFAALMEKYKKNATPWITAGATTVAILGIVPKLVSSAKKSKDSLESMRKTSEGFVERIKRNKTGTNTNNVQAICDAVMQSIGLMVDDIKNREAGHKSLLNLFGLVKGKDNPPQP